MKPVISAETIASEDKVRKSLHELQPSATDKETLVGADRMIKSTQQAKETKSKKNVSTKKKKEKDVKKQINVTINNKAVQTVSEEKREIEVEDLTCTNLAGPSENYWQVLAERRRVALKDALEENKELAERVKKLEEEKRIYKEMLDETKALVEVLQDMIGDDRNDINNSLEDSVL
ncbi:PREDICTED: geminin-like isoform X2 [Wasmannia auropunctata]|uniref:geminin-like isoform X2 n=1 Tax=Wasmannia auropunctata TaxID=64793 RepID=UPI0005EDEA71|nr:PREDICTED: geminin-like isoform X2 [Wasmannia auropunctata]